MKKYTGHFKDSDPEGEVEEDTSIDDVDFIIRLREKEVDRLSAQARRVRTGSQDTGGSR